MPRSLLPAACVLLLAAPLFAADLPVTRVTLFSSGVGLYQRDGNVMDDATIELHFKSEQINDILKSLVLLDLDGGTVSTVTYASRDPVDKALASFGVDLTGRPTLAQLLDQLRGAGVEVTSAAAGKRVSGTILGVETHKRVVNETSTTEYVLNVLSGDGLQSIVLEPGQRIRLTDEELNEELRQALCVLAGSHDADKKSVSLLFNGAGDRRVQVAYLLEAPLWKTSYRLVLRDNDKAMLQGWAIVENTTNEDWENVALSLVSGRPISFIQDLYQPLYLPRPVVEPELYTSLRPQTYGGAIDKMEADDEATQAGGRMRQLRRREKSSGQLFQGGQADAAPAPPSLAFMGRLESLGYAGSAAAGADVGELFAYNIETPVTLARQTSAMLPIVTGDVSAEKVSIYNPYVIEKYPLNGLLLKNTTDLHLMQGPITVFDGDTYAGDARLDDMQPGEQRLISYALDLGCEGDVRSPDDDSKMVSMRIARGTLTVTLRTTNRREYVFKSRDDKTRTMIVEQQMADDWKLVGPAEPFERARGVYRFRINVPAGEKKSLNVAFERIDYRNVALASNGLDAIRFYIRSDVIGKSVQDALEKLVQMRQDIDERRREIAAREAEVIDITQEQSRIRDNLRTIPRDSDLFARLLTKLDDQETRLETLNGELAELREQQEAKQKGLDAFLLNLDVE